jgi:subtilisin family serine protease
MTSEDIAKIYSNDYADFLINYSGDISALEQYKNSAINIINFFTAVEHLPVSQMTEDIISKMGYSSIPALLGLISEASLEASGILRIRSIPNFDLRGKGVLIGIVDSGIDYTNPIFQMADKTTRIASIWDQTIISDTIPAGMAYGTEYTKEQINEALKNENPFSIVPSKDEIGHGTMIAGIAAGNEVPESGFYGVAPEAELVIVKLKPAKPYLKQFSPSH